MAEHNTEAIDILSDITIYTKYARYLPEKKRRETWEEICARNCKMHTDKFPSLKDEIEQIYKEFVVPKKVLPSMRSLQFGGRPISLNPARIYNCSFLIMNDIKAFSECMFLLLSGCGVGFSVQKSHVNALPTLNGVIKPTGSKRKKRYLIPDSIEGWASAIDTLISSYFNGMPEIDFDFGDIRSKGSYLATAGGKAPGPAPLRRCLVNITNILEDAIQARGRGTKLKPIEIHDIICHISDAVLSGGIRRSSCISLFSLDDDEMLYSKSGKWWELNSQRARANNSAVVVKGRIKKSQFIKLLDITKNSYAGEPGVFLTNDPNIGTNPCAEISLKDCGLCNLTEINVSNIESQQDLNDRVKAATILGTLQASYTNFHFLRDRWEDIANEEALLGVSMTGVASNKIWELNIKEAASIAKDINLEWATRIGINPAKRITTIKPAGTTSCVFGCSSGIHPWHAPYYIRRMRVNKDESIYRYLKRRIPKLVEDEIGSPNDTAVISVPIKAPDGALTRDMSDAISLLESVKQLHRDWIQPGHNDGANTHNISCTISIRDEEWDNVADWMWNNREYYTAISMLPYDGGTYQQMPFEEITEDEYNEMIPHLRSINLENVVEDEDNTNLQGEAACVGGVCGI